MLRRLSILIAASFALALACADDAAQRTAPAPQDQQEIEVQEHQPEQPQPARAQQQSEQPTPQQQAAPPEPPQDSTTEPNPTSEPLPQPEFDFTIAESYLEHIAGVLGPRASATDQERIAAEYLAEVFSALGYEAELQEFDFTNPVTITRIQLPARPPAAAFLFPGASGAPVVGPVVVVPGIGEPADYDGIDVRGAVVIVQRGVIEFRAKASHAEAAGAAALIIANETAGQGFGGTFRGDAFDIPVFLVGAEDGRALRLLEGTNLSIPEADPADGSSQNVIARAPGGVCRIVVGGHYDTVPDVDGANDNGSGTALTLAFAEAWADHPAARDICFVGFGAEELGLHGSLALVSEWRTSGALADVEAMLNLDAIGDGRAPYIVIASPALRPLATSLITQLQIDAQVGTQPDFYGSDHEPFADALKDVVFVFPPGAVLHTPADNLSNVNWTVYNQVARLNHALLGCLLERIGSPVVPAATCGE